MKLENVDLSQLGRAKKVSVSKVRGTLPSSFLTVNTSLAVHAYPATLCQQDPVSTEKLRLVDWNILQRPVQRTLAVLERHRPRKPALHALSFDEY